MTTEGVAAILDHQREEAADFVTLQQALWQRRYSGTVTFHYHNGVPQVVEFPGQRVRLHDGSAVIAKVRHPVELDGGALLRGQPLEPHHVALADPVLLSARDDHRLHDLTSRGRSPCAFRSAWIGSFD